MSTLVRTNSNFPSLIENFFGRDVNDFFNTSHSDFTHVPAVNVAEHQDGFRIEVAAPGLKKENFKLHLNHNNLTISGSQETRTEESEKLVEKYTRREFSYSSFQRTFTLPTSVDADRIQATYTDGILKIDIPKREEAKVKPPRQIEIGG
ncbi:MULTISPECIES: Hsp20/alpha crystallin family protein [unclassified Spirosoma]|uniref:Hsp20/alpha crystallin family protein n=1 Tax=unclassified Spirosoma TaxID=2621999 RepID=UPI00095FAD52|nr:MULTISPECIES: Hsp20/alpha crystallin family protein [unclassified Spirosoma]MBN8823140.1 Hsp20/alpha crystallin family protein [Spirosoma sp.]OJW73226.1 MAG: heat-shock protein [Spirosoma sp. 48-14]